MKEWITGRNPVYEVLRTRRRDVFRLWVAAGVEEKGRLAEILKLAASRKLKVERVPRGQIDNLGEAGSQAQGVALETSAYPYAALADILECAGERKEPLFVLLLDMIQNPQNLGTLLRTAEAVGVHGVVMPLRRAAGVTPAVVHASVGASEHLLVAQVNMAQAIDELKEAGAWVIGLEGGDEAQPSGSVRLDGGSPVKRALPVRPCSPAAAGTSRGPRRPDRPQAPSPRPSAVRSPPAAVPRPAAVAGCARDWRRGRRTRPRNR